MPTYEYECTKCGKVFDLFQSITEPARRRLKKTDPKPCGCNAPVKRRLGTGGGIIFKGSGFYETDYRSESYKKAQKAETDTGKDKSDKSGDKKKDAKAEPKKDSSTKEPAGCASRS
jgi:putative FmdB family regulatory protein